MTTCLRFVFLKVSAVSPSLLYCHARKVSFKSSALSRLSAAIANKICDSISGNKRDGGGVQSGDVGKHQHPRAETEVAAAARRAGGHSLWIKTVGKRALVPVAAETEGRLGQLSANGKLAASKGPACLYEHLISTGKICTDDAQTTALEKLEELSQALLQNSTTISRQTPGLYLHGEVGAGKSMLMDVFLASIQQRAPCIHAYRSHLHDFMHGVHAELQRMNALGDDTAPNNCVFAMNESSTRGAPPQSLATLVQSVPGSQHRPCSPFFPMLPADWWLLGDINDDYGRRRTGRAAGTVQLVRTGGDATSVEKLGRALATRLDILCFDEVAITSIQDCVVLGPLLRVICESGVAVVSTSNRAPEDLYAGGLNRHVHLPPLVAAIRQHCQVYELTSQTDHRTRIARDEMSSSSSFASDHVFYWGCNPGCAEGVAFLDRWWCRASSGNDSSSASVRTVKTSEFNTDELNLQKHAVEIGYGRSLMVHSSPCRSCARFSFEELCAAPLGTKDFSELCGQFRMLLISDVPRMRGTAVSEAQRWIWLIDYCYERHTRLIFTSAADGPEDLVDLHSVANVGAGGGRSLKEVSFAVKRTCSRIREMGTQSFQRACTKNWMRAE